MTRASISLEDCERVSKHVSKVLDVNEFSENYSLEVSSPGLDRKFLTQISIRTLWEKI